MDIILKYFPDITEEQKQFAALYDLYTEWMQKSTLSHAKTLKTCMSTTCYTRWVLHAPVPHRISHHGFGYGRWFSGHTVGYLFSRSAFSLGWQYRQEGAGGYEGWRVPLVWKTLLSEVCKGREESKRLILVCRAVMPLPIWLNNQKTYRWNNKTPCQTVLICLKAVSWNTKPCLLKHKRLCTTWAMNSKKSSLKPRKAVYVMVVNRIILSKADAPWRSASF